MQDSGNKSLGVRKATSKQDGVSFIPIERTNDIIMINSIPGTFEKVKTWLKILDTVDAEAEEKVFSILL